MHRIFSSYCSILSHLYNYTPLFPVHAYVTKHKKNEKNVRFAFFFFLVSYWIDPMPQYILFVFFEAAHFHGSPISK